jgi:hypothetical protein
MSVQLPTGQTGSDPAAEHVRSKGFNSGADAGLYVIGIISILAFISMIGVLFWVAARDKLTPGVTVLVTPSPSENEVLLPIISEKSTNNAQDSLAPGTVSIVQSTPYPPLMVSTTATEVLDATVTSGFTPMYSPTPTATIQPNSTSSATPGRSVTPTVTGTSSPTLTPTFSGELTSLLIRNDQSCLDLQNNDLYIFGEIVNNNPVSVDILNWDVKIYDNDREILTDDIFLDVPNNYAVFANSAIPFTLVTSLDWSTFTDYDISLDYAPGLHNPRNDLRILEYTATQSGLNTEVTGKWSYTDLENPPDIIWIIATMHDAQGKLINLEYQRYLNASVPDPQLPAGQHYIRQLYLEDNPCGTGTVSVSIIGE